MAADITPEAIGFLSAVGVFVVALAVLFLFINKKLCFSNVGGLPCLEEHGHRRRKKTRSGIRQGLVNSYGDDDDDDDATSSSNSEDEVLKQFEISVSRSQSFRYASTAANTAVTQNQNQNQDQPPPSRRHKFNRLVEDQEEGSTEPSDCEAADMDAQKTQPFQDPLSAPGAEEQEGPSTTGSLNIAQGPEASLREGSLEGQRATPTPSMIRQAPDGSIEMETAVDLQGYDNQNQDPTDSSSTWSPEQDHPAVPLEEPVSQPVSVDPRPPISKCGDLVISLEYRPDTEKLLVTVITARDIPDKGRSGMDSWQVHAVLLPAKKQRHKTSLQRGALPHFNETFRFSRLDPSDLALSALRFRLYALGGRMSRERMMGEKVLRLGGLDPHGGTTEMSLVLEPRSNLKSVDSQLSLSAVSQSDSASSTQSLTHGGVPELLVGLAYNATTGRMSVEIIKGSHFRNLAINRPPEDAVQEDSGDEEDEDPDKRISIRGHDKRIACEEEFSDSEDEGEGGRRNVASNKKAKRTKTEAEEGEEREKKDTYGRLTLLNSVGQEISRCKTSVRRGQPNPVYKETFVFQVALFQLSDVTLMVSIYNRRSMKRKEMVGWVALGQNSSGEEEQLHWQDMKDGRGQQVCRWHVLLEG